MTGFERDLMGIIGTMRNKVGKEIKAGFGYTLGNILVNGIAFLTMPIFTRMMTKEGYGLLSIYSTYVNVCVIIIGLNLGAAIVRGYIDFKEEYDDFLSANLFLSLISFVTFSILLYVFRGPITSASDFPLYIWVFIFLQSYFTFIINFNSSKCIVQYKYKQQVAISLVNTIVGVAISIVLVFLFEQNKYLGRIIGQTIPMVIIGVILLIVLLSKGKKYISKEYWSYSLKLSIPIMPHLLAHLILGQSDRLLIRKYVSDAATGVYSVAYTIGVIIQIILMSINNAWLPWFNNKMVEKSYDEIRKVSSVISVVFVFLSLGLILISPELLKIVAPEYGEAAFVIPIVILAYVFQFAYTMLVNVQFFHKKNYFVPIGTSIAAGLNIVLNIIYIPRFGFAAAAYTTVISYFVLFLVHYFVNKVILKSDVFKGAFFIKFLSVAVVSTGLFFLIQDMILVRYIIIVIMCLGMAYRYRNQIKGFLNN